MHAPRSQWPAGLVPIALLLARLAVAALLGGCLQADTLGDEPPTVVQVGSPPRWDNGIGELMRLKCGVCHAVPRPATSPVETPQDFDLNYHINAPSGADGAQSIVSDIVDGILRSSAGDERMPLNYATPLVESEILALEAWDGS